MKVYFIKYTLVKDGNSAWNTNHAVILKSPIFIEDMEYLEKILKNNHDGSLSNRTIRIDTLNFLHEVPEEKEKVYIDGQAIPTDLMDFEDGI